MKQLLHSYQLTLVGLILCLGLQSFISACTEPTGKSNTILTSTKQPEPTYTSPQNTSLEAPENAGPKPGKWVATVSNGYKGDQLIFTVSPDGKRIENVEFKGHWRSRSSYIERLEHLDPPKPFAIIKNSFSGVQQDGQAGMWWEFIGNFTSATTAEGSYRCSFSGGENDTHKLKWTAKYTGK